jgi:hypothetical protein
MTLGMASSMRAHEKLTDRDGPVHASKLGFAVRSLSGV